MPNPVFNISVDLTTKTASFTSGLSDAARAARGSFSDIKEGAAEMGRETGYSMGEARHGVMLLGEEFGVHIPRGITSFIASLGPVGAAMEAAFPFLAIVVGATLLLEHLAKLREEGQKLATSQANFGTTVANVLNALDSRLLEAGIKTDELNHNHLGALEKQLQLIDRTSMNELVQSFGTVSKAADATFAELKSSWYQWGIGSAGAKAALDNFKTQYDSLLARGKDKEANDLLAGTKQSAEHVLDLMKQAKDNQTVTGSQGTHQGDYAKFEAAKNELKKLGVGWTEKEYAAQETLLGALNAQAEVENKIAALKAAQQGNARQETQGKLDTDADAAARQQAQAAKLEADEKQRLWEENYRRAVSDLEENERQKIDATEKGSAARLAAITAAIQEENARGLQETGFYKTLLNDRIRLIQQMSDEEKKIKAEAVKESAAHDMEMAKISLAAGKEELQARMAITAMTSQEILDAQMSLNAREHALQVQALSQEIAALDQSDREYENKKKALQDKILQLDAQFYNKQNQLEIQAQQKEAALLTSWSQRQQDVYAQGFSKVLMGKESFGKMMQTADTQIASQALSAALQSLVSLETVQGRKRFGDARTAAADAFANAGNPIVGAIEAGAAFAAVMAFEEGGLVPGVGKGDVVPAMLEPGETVLTKRMTENLQNASSDSGGNHNHVHLTVHHHVQALDRDGFEQVLQKHASTIEKHVNSQLRRMNR